MQKLNLVNGIIFTGGWAKDGLYFDVIKGIFQVIIYSACTYLDSCYHAPIAAIFIKWKYSAFGLESVTKKFDIMKFPSLLIRIQDSSKDVLLLKIIIMILNASLILAESFGEE